MKLILLTILACLLAILLSIPVGTTVLKQIQEPSVGERWAMGDSTMICNGTNEAE